MSLLAAFFDLGMVAWAIRLTGLAAFAGVTTATVALIYRSRFQDRFPDGAALIIGLGVVAIYLNTRILLIEFVRENGSPFAFSVAVANLIVFIVAAAASLAGRTAGDRLGTSDRFQWSGIAPAWSPIVRATGRFITVTLPDEIDDIEGYDPVSSDAKERLAGLTLDFPRGLTVEDLREQLAIRLKEKYDVGYVDVDLRGDGTVEYLALGQRAAGLGPTLPPGTAAVALRADPPFSASPGDTVEIWDPEQDESVGTAELRASIDGEVTTVACGRATAQRIDPTRTYRLLTLPAGGAPDREFAAILRRREETMGVIDVAADSPLVGTRTGELDGTLIAVDGPEGIETVPGRERKIAAGDRLFVLGRPEELRALGAAQGIGSIPLEAAVEEAEVHVEAALPSLEAIEVEPDPDAEGAQDRS